MWQGQGLWVNPISLEKFFLARFQAQEPFIEMKHIRDKECKTLGSERIPFIRPRNCNNDKKDLSARFQAHVPFLRLSSRWLKVLKVNKLCFGTDEAKGGSVFLWVCERKDERQARCFGEMEEKIQVPLISSQGSCSKDRRCLGSFLVV